jgi:hypothetical protein
VASHGNDRNRTLFFTFTHSSSSAPNPAKRTFTSCNYKLVKLPQNISLVDIITAVSMEKQKIGNGNDDEKIVSLKPTGLS